MKRLLEWLLNLEQVRLNDNSQLQWQWQQPLDAWLWFVIVLVTGAYVAMVYRRETGSLIQKAVPAGLRGLTIILVILLLTKPALVHRYDRREPSTVAILVDQSASMSLKDYYAPDIWNELVPLLGSPGESRSCERWKLVQSLLHGNQQALIKDILANHEVRLFGFSSAPSNAELLANINDLTPVLEKWNALQPTGPATNIAGAIKQVFDACIDAHLTAMVLLTDGQPTQDSNWQTVADLSRTRGTPIYIVPIGSSEPPQDLAIESVQADNFVYLGDQVAVKFQLRASGFPPKTSIQVSLNDAESQTPLTTKTIQTGDDDETLNDELRFVPKQTGPLQLAVSVPVADGEVQTSNNAQQIRLTVVDDKVKVLYVEGYPRFEYRYLKNTLLREASVTSSILLLSADEEFIQEGTEPIRRFPSSAEELNEYDAILMGDVDPSAGWISTAQMDLIVEFVRQRGGGLGIIAGERNAPQRWWGTPLDKLIPVELSSLPSDVQTRQDQQPFLPQLTSTGRESPIFRLQIDQNNMADLLERLPEWYWSYEIPAAKAGTEVLLQHPRWRHNQSPVPLVIVGRFGAGATFFQSSDDSWRWRKHQGEAFFDTYWLQIVRYLGRYKKIKPDIELTLRTEQNQVEVHQPVVITLELENPTLSAQLPDQLQADIFNASGIKLSETSLIRLTADSKHFQGHFIPTEPGQYDVLFVPERYALSLPQAHAYFQARQESLETRKPQANIELMQQLADTTSGKIVEPAQALQLANLIPQRDYLIPDDITETVWDSKAILFLFVLLIGTEWAWRKLNGMT